MCEKKKELSEQDDKTLRRLGFRKQIKLTRLTMKIYNKVCNTCKVKIVNDPKKGMDLICTTCIKKVESIIKEIEKMSQ